MIPAGAADNGALVSRDAAYDRIAMALRLYVGRGRRYSVKQLANATGVKDRVIECAKAGADSEDFRPIGAGDLLSCCKFLGPEFTSEVLVLADQAACWLPDEDDTPPGALAADLTEASATIARGVASGFPREGMPAVHRAGLMLVTRGAQLQRMVA